MMLMSLYRRFERSVQRRQEHPARGRRACSSPCCGFLPGQPLFGRREPNIQRHCARHGLVSHTFVSSAGECLKIHSVWRRWHRYVCRTEGQRRCEIRAQKGDPAGVVFVGRVYIQREHGGLSIWRHETGGGAYQGP